MSKEKPTVKKSSKPHVGRVKGTPNKKTQDIMDKLKAIGCDPILGMAKIAKEALEAGDNRDLALAGQMFKELAQYVAPKRKAIEHTGLDGELLLPPVIQIVHE